MTDTDDGWQTGADVEVRPTGGEPRSILSITMPRAVLREVTQIARSHGKTPAAWCLDVIESHVERAGLTNIEGDGFDRQRETP